MFSTPKASADLHFELLIRKYFVLYLSLPNYNETFNQVASSYLVVAFVVTTVLQNLRYSTCINCNRSHKIPE